MAQTDVRIDRVTKRFGDVVAVDDLSLDIVRGEFFSMLGPSGCGKTTTLRMIAGFEEATAGSIFLGEKEVTDLPPYKRDVNTVFQNYALFPHLNVYENVAFGLRRRKVASDEVKRRVAEMLELVELPGYDRRRPHQLSGGQQQRVALARALINRPRVLLLDEPLGALDLKLRKQMQVELKRIQTEVGITFIYVTHDQEEAMTMSDRIAVMRGGRIEQLDTPEDLYERPRTAFVAGFLGSSNLLAGKVRRVVDDTVEIELAAGQVVRAKGAGLADGQSVRVGVRPEKFALVTAADSTGAVDESSPSASDSNVVHGTVLDASYLGVSTEYTVQLHDGLDVKVYMQNTEASSATPHCIRGDRVRLSWRPDHTFLITDETPVAVGGETTDA